MERPATRITYSCVVGHEIEATCLDELTEVTFLDQGAEVRLCKEHLTPVAITVIPASALEGSQTNAAR